MANLLANALKPLAASASTMSVPMATESSSAAGPSTTGGARRGGKQTARRGGGAGGMAGSSMEGDVGMKDASASAGGAMRRGRTQARTGTNDRGGKGNEKPYGRRPGGGGRVASLPALIASSADGTPKRLASGVASTSSGAGSGAIETLRAFLASRYSSEANLLNLENMASDTVLNAAGLKAPGQKGAAPHLSGALWKVAGELFPNLVSLSLANNGLTSLLPLSPFHIAQHLPKLENLSLSANKLKRLSDLDGLSPSVGKKGRPNASAGGLLHLRELVLIGNPLTQHGGGEDVYRREVARRFPSLTQLDQTPLDPSIAFSTSGKGKGVAGADAPGLSPGARKQEALLAKKQANSRNAWPFPIRVAGGFCDSDETRALVSAFCVKFFMAFDEPDRSSLGAAYAPTALFSFYVDTVVPQRSKLKKIGAHGDRKFPNQHKLSWTPYLSADNGSRNLQRVTQPAKRRATLHLGPPGLLTSFAKLPRTSHPISDASKFVFDAWQMPGLQGDSGAVVLFATVHGEFVESPSQGVRSFDRTFILAPVPPESPAQAAGWPCIILSDILAIRGYSDPDAWKVVVDPAPAPPSTAQQPGVQRAEGISDAQQEIVLQLQAATRLTYHWAHLALEQNGWDPNVAFANFQALQQAGSIPQEAFIPA